MQNLTKWAAMLCVAVLMAVSASSFAFAHANLIASDPADGSVLADAPDRLNLRFSEPVRPLVARLTHPDGRTEVLHDIGDKGDAISIALPAGLERGTHVLSWRVTSSDGHPIGGGLVFSVGAPSALNAATSETDFSVRIGLWASRTTWLLSLIFGVGGAVFSASVVRGPDAKSRWLDSLLIPAGLLATPLFIGFQGLDALGEPISALLRAEVWEAGLFATSFGRATLIGATALALAWASMQSPTSGPVTGLLAWAALACVGLAAASAGHAATASPVALTRPTVFLHAVTATLWIGALVPLWKALRHEDAAGGEVLTRFSRVIPVVVGLLVLSGLILSVVQLRSVEALWTTNYGLVFLAKLALVFLLLLIAAFNRYRLTGSVLAGDLSATASLRRIIVAEIVLGCLVIGVIGLWRFTPPPRALLAVSGPEQTIDLAKEGVSARLTVRPATVGPVLIDIEDLRLNGEPLDPLSIEVELAKPAYGLGPFEHLASKTSEGRYRASGFVLPLDGFWVVRVTVLVSDFVSVTLVDVLDIARPAG
nr:copper resistance protein CopC [Rhizobium sp. ACO-34A]